MEVFKDDFQNLNFFVHQRQKSELIKVNPHYGNPISKKLIPQENKDKYGIANLFRIELPDYWRMLYTLTDGESKI